MKKKTKFMIVQYMYMLKHPSEVFEREASPGTNRTKKE
jgi:hypothetical protein